MNFTFTYHNSNKCHGSCPSHYKSYQCWNPSVDAKRIFFCPHLCNCVSKAKISLSVARGTLSLFWRQCEALFLCSTWNKQELWAQSAKAGARCCSPDRSSLAVACEPCLGGTAPALLCSLQRLFCSSNDKGMWVSRKAETAARLWMAVAQSTILNAESQRNLVERKINLSNSLRFRKGRGGLCDFFSGKILWYKEDGWLRNTTDTYYSTLYRVSPIKYAKQLHKL